VAGGDDAALPAVASARCAASPEHERQQDEPRRVARAHGGRGDGAAARHDGALEIFVLDACRPPLAGGAGACARIRAADPDIAAAAPAGAVRDGDARRAAGGGDARAALRADGLAIALAAAAGGADAVEDGLVERYAARVGRVTLLVAGRR